jgi:RimJ/RimL family protein N-acetyltransferase
MRDKAARSDRFLRCVEGLADALRERDAIGGMTSLDRDLSLGWRTDLIFARFDGHVDDRGNHLCVRTPANPTFWWGNFLLFHHAPGPGDLERWMALFDEEIASRQPASKHRAFGVDMRERLALPPEFAAAGFTLSEATVLTLARDQLLPAPRPMPEGVAFRVLDLARDGDAVVDKQVAVDSSRFEPTGYREFAQRQGGRYAAMQDAGLGHWFGLVARVDDRAVLAASCGLFRASARVDDPASRLGRFQYVSTHPAWRRRGLCTALVHAVCRHGFEAMGLDTLVMVADPDDVAIGVYESLGYRRGTSTWQFERPPR